MFLRLLITETGAMKLIVVLSSYETLHIYARIFEECLHSVWNRLRWDRSDRDPDATLPGHPLLNLQQNETQLLKMSKEMEQVVFPAMQDSKDADQAGMIASHL